MNTLLTREELELQKIYREYAEERVRPHTLEIDRGQFDAGILIHEMHKLGFCGIVIPEEYGGLGSSYVHYVLAVEALARASGPVAKSVSGQTNMCFPILKYGTEAQKQKYVVPWVRGDKTSAFTLTEPGAGSDAASIQTSAVLKDGQYIVNGTKAFITGAREADFFQTYCQFRDGSGEKKPMCLLIDVHECPGITVGRDEELMGMRAKSVAEVVFDDVHVPEENLLGRIGEGFHVAMSTLDAGRLGISALCVGMAQDAIDQTVKYTRERIQFGKRISQFQNTQFKLAEYQTKTEAVRLMVYNCASMMDSGRPASHLSSMAKYYAADVLNEVVRGCLQLHGGYGYSKEFAIEKLYRDAKLTEIFEGTSEVQKKIIAKWMGVK